MRKIANLMIMALLCANISMAQNTYQSPTEGVVTYKFVPEKQMQADLLDMLVKFVPYMVKNYSDLSHPNGLKEDMGAFKSNEYLISTEDCIRTNADLGMVSAFLWKYGQVKKIPLPDSITYDQLYNMAKKSLIYTYSTHKANKYHRGRDQRNWGSIISSPQFESSLWAMSIAYQTYFLWDSLSQGQRTIVKRLLDAECEFIVSNPIQVKYNHDTRAEENGWDACVLAATIGLFPDSDKNEKYFKQLRRVAINTLSHRNDNKDTSVIDPEIDKTRVKDLYAGQNLYNDYTMQNHNYFHPGYQNVVIQELGEAALALKMFQRGISGTEKYRTNALFHNCKVTQDSVLHYLALPDGELAMPNGNDWSQFLFDQITSYSTMACFLRDPDALWLENQAYKNIKARQSTTDDGSWLLKSDIGPRRMGVQAHRVMMTYLMHEMASTASMKPGSWQDLNRRYQHAKVFTDQSVVRASSPDRYVIFSLSKYNNFSGYFTPNTPDCNKIVVPFNTTHGMGNFMGWYTMEGTGENASNSAQPNFEIDSNSFVMTMQYSTNNHYIDRRQALYCTPGNAVIAIDMNRNNKGIHTVKEENCGVITMSIDPFTNTRRVLHSSAGCDTIYADTEWRKKTSWVNIDNKIGIITCNSGDSLMKLSKMQNISSINMRHIATSYSDRTYQVKDNQYLGSHAMVCLSNVTASETRKWKDKTHNISSYLDEGWMGITTEDMHGRYILISNLFGTKSKGNLNGLPMGKDEYFPVLKTGMRIREHKVFAELELNTRNSIGQRASFMIKGNNVDIRYISKDTIVIQALEDTAIKLAYSNPETEKLMETKTIKMRKYTALPFIWNRKKIIY